MLVATVDLEHLVTIAQNAIVSASLRYSST